MRLTVFRTGDLQTLEFENVEDYFTGDGFLVVSAPAGTVWIPTSTIEFLKALADE